MDTTNRNFEFAAALKRLGGDAQLFRELAAYFLEDSDELLKVISRGLDASDAGRIERAAHNLRGLAANFDAEPIISIARSIEQAASQRQLQSVSAAFAELEIEVQSLRTVLRGYIGEWAAQSVRPEARRPERSISDQSGRLPPGEWSGSEGLDRQNEQSKKTG